MGVVGADGDVVGFPHDEIVGQHVEHVAPVDELPPAMPVRVAKHALADEVPAARPRHRAQVDVGQMSEREQRDLETGLVVPGVKVELSCLAAQCTRAPNVTDCA